MQDTNVDHETAVRTMRRSARYGTAVFPHDDQDIYDEMIVELLSSHNPKKPNDPSPGVRNSVNGTISVVGRERGGSPSDDGADPVSSPTYRADKIPSNCTIVIPSDVVSDTGTSQGEKDSVSSAVDHSFHQRRRRRKLPRSMIPTILTESEELDSASGEDTPVWKKCRLA